MRLRRQAPDKLRLDGTHRWRGSRVDLAGTRLLFVVNDPRFFVSHRLPIAAEAKQAGAEVHVATPMGEAVAAITAAGLVHHTIAMSRSGMAPWREYRSFVQLYRLFRQLRPSIVHTVTIKPMIYGGIAARLAGVPALVSAVSGLGYLFLATRWRARLGRVVVSLAYSIAFGHPRHRAIFQNPDDRDMFVRGNIIRAENAVIIRGSGLDIDRFPAKPEPPGVPVVLLASRMLLDKGVAEFVAAAKLLRSQGVIARFVLVGESDPHNPAGVSVEQLVSWQQAGDVEWWGRRENMHEVFAQCHIVCLPSYREGLPKVLIEAASSGRPIVTTDVPGCREVVQHNVNGLLVPLRDVETLAQAIGVLINDPARRHRMGRCGRQMAEAEFSVKRIIRETMLVYGALAVT